MTPPCIGCRFLVLPPTIWRPRRRSNALVVEELLDEVLAYDLRSQRAHNLNPAAARVWKLCDGERTVSEIARALDAQEAVGTTDEALVLDALRGLADADLLEAPLPTVRAVDESRRRVLAVAGWATLAPFVTSVAIPASAFAQSAPGGGSLITFNLSGTANLLAFGGSTSAAIEGSATYDPGAAAVTTTAQLSTYLLSGVTLSIGGSSVAANIAPDSFVGVYNDVSGSDQFSLSLTFTPPLDMGGSQDVERFFIDLALPGSTFSTTDLPGNLEFLTVVTLTVSAFEGGVTSASLTGLIVEPAV